MLHNMAMPRGKSGRIVLEVDPDEKQELYEALEKDGFTLKDWFLSQARSYMRNRSQTEMVLMVAEDAPVFDKPQNEKER